jgi:hypothetical protein
MLLEKKPCKPNFVGGREGEGTILVPYTSTKVFYSSFLSYCSGFTSAHYSDYNVHTVT